LMLEEVHLVRVFTSGDVDFSLICLFYFAHIYEGDIGYFEVSMRDLLLLDHDLFE
jgi:hypothetical protein